LEKAEISVIFTGSVSGDANWVITSADKNSGIYSAQSGAIGDSQSASLEITINCASGNIVFYQRVSSETNKDFLRFYIDGIEKEAVSGNGIWEMVSYPVAAGSRVFRWTYSKSIRKSSYSDAAWIDDITFPIQCYPGDFDRNGSIDLIDLNTLSNQWLQSGGVLSADIAPPPDGDGIVNFLDFALFAENWLAGVQ